jgi:hypothetical protein
MDCRQERGGILFAIHGLSLKVWFDHGKPLQPAATTPSYYVPEDFAKLFVFMEEARSPIAIQIDPSPKIPHSSAGHPRGLVPKTDG